MPRRLRYGTRLPIAGWDISGLSSWDERGGYTSLVPSRKKLDIRQQK